MNGYRATYGQFIPINPAANEKELVTSWFKSDRWLDPGQTISYSRPYASAFCSNLKAPSSPGKAGEGWEFAIGRRDFFHPRDFRTNPLGMRCVCVFKVDK